MSSLYYTVFILKQQEQAWNEATDWNEEIEKRNGKEDRRYYYNTGKTCRRKGAEMLSLLFLICMFGVFGKLFLFGIKAAWSIGKFVLTIVFLPVILIGMVVGGLLYLAIPILIVVAIIGLVVSR